MPIAPGIHPIPDAIRAEMHGRSHHPDPRCPDFDALRLLVLRHIDFHGQPGLGELIVAQDLAQEVREIFEQLHALCFPIASMQRIDAFEGDDDRSMAANNTSGFNFRLIDGTATLSRHALGRAIDINPVQNPWLRAGRIDPDAGRAYLDRAHLRPGMIAAGGPVVRAFELRGWRWGGDHPHAPDYHHFSK